MDFNQALSLVEETLAQTPLVKDPEGLYAPIQYTLDNGGKRIRPALVLMAFSVFSDSVTEAVNPAIGLEILHNFTLLHDDIMDNADVRRGKPSVHAKWNPNTAILSGDAMLIMAYQYAAMCHPKYLAAVLKEFSKAGLEICEGQQFDMDFEARSNVEIEEYIEMIRLKTAVLLGASLKIGAILGGASEYNSELLYNFGINIGLAFQLKDDILDVYGNAETFGKEPGGDIASNKKTFLFLKSLELANEEQQDKLKHWLSLTEFDKNDKYMAVKGIYDELGVREEAELLMNSYFIKALKLLDQLEDNESSVLDLKMLAEMLMNRTK